MTKSLPEPLMLDGKPYYSACQIAEMRLPGLPGTRRGVKAKALSESWPLLSRPSGRGGGRVYPLEALPDEAQAEIRRRTRPKPTQPAPANSASTQEKTEPQKAPLSRPWAGSEGEGRGEGRGGRPVETLQEARLQGDIHPRRPQGFLRTLEGRPGRSGGAGAQSLAIIRRPLPCTDGTGLWRRAV